VIKNVLFIDIWTENVIKNILLINCKLINLVEQGCGKCPVNSENFCKTCKTKYCNEENQVYEYCLQSDGKSCTKKFNYNCFTERIKDNKGLNKIKYLIKNNKYSVNKGCGNCPSTTCIECKGNLCNEITDPPFYCLDGDGKSLRTCTKPECFVSKG